jgi:hypothetical protein
MKTSAIWVRACASLCCGVLLGSLAGNAGAAGFGDMLGALAGRSGSGNGERDLSNALQRLAAQMNRDMPRDVDEQVRLDRVSTGPGPELIYHYTLRSKRASEVPTGMFNARIAPVLRERLCHDPQMQPLLKSGAAIGYEYRGSDGGDIGKLSFRQRDCSSRS